MKPAHRATVEFERLMGIVAYLRSPEGCLWDRSQTPQDAGRYVIEEAYEVLDAITEDSPDHLKEELGDLLFQVLFVARMLEESGKFDVAQVMAGISEKMIRRHPHVFGNNKADSVDAIKKAWEEVKACERQGQNPQESIFQNIPRSLPPLTRARKVTEKASKAGFDWNSIEGVLEKLDEEMREFRKALTKQDCNEVEAELGDLLFSMVNLSRFAGIDPDRALARSIAKFLQRFAFIESSLKKEGKTPQDATMEEMDRLWDLSKTTCAKGDARIP